VMLHQLDAMVEFFLNAGPVVAGNDVVWSR
jgi:hypothetical protein